MRFSIGEKVVFLKESGEGIVKEYLSEGKVLVTDLETSFDREFLESHLAKIEGDLSQALKGGLNYWKDYHDDKSYNIDSSITHIRREKSYWEIDLHTHAFLNSEQGMDNTTLLNKQLSEFKNFFNAAQSKLIRKLIVIHGIGKGTLKEEVREFLNGKDNVEYYDASYREYGKGATEVRIYYTK